LLQIGAWLDVNGAAIYGTRPWKQFGEDKVRFTTKGKTLYAILLGWPGKEAVIPALAAGKVAGKIEKINLLGHTGALQLSQDETGLHVTMPDEKLCDYAFALEIAGLDL
jgi:alpha-L-fucosidase